MSEPTTTYVKLSVTMARSDNGALVREVGVALALKDIKTIEAALAEVMRLRSGTPAAAACSNTLGKLRALLPAEE